MRLHYAAAFVLACSMASATAYAADSSSSPSGTPDEDARIVGGELSAPGSWPKVVAIYQSAQLCTGTVVHPKLILTAAHCLANQPKAKNIELYFGDSIEQATQVSSASSYGIHPDFCRDCGEDIDDIAFIVPDSPIDFGGVTRPLPITDNTLFQELMRAGSSVTLVGFGQDEQGEAQIKREVQTSLTNFSPLAREFAAGGDGKDSCVGDSGGPAFVRSSDGRWHLAGITSRGYPECGRGGIYTVPFPYLCWLRDESGVDLLPEGCSSCDCVELPATVESSCRIAPSEDSAPPGWLSLLFLGGLWGGLRFRRKAAR